jgi:hypothetical protein
MLSLLKAATLTATLLTTTLPASALPTASPRTLQVFKPGLFISANPQIPGHVTFPHP